MVYFCNSMFCLEIIFMEYFKVCETFHKYLSLFSEQFWKETKVEWLKDLPRVTTQSVWPSLLLVLCSTLFLELPGCSVTQSDNVKIDVSYIVWVIWLYLTCVTLLWPSCITFGASVSLPFR